MAAIASLLHQHQQLLLRSVAIVATSNNSSLDTRTWSSSSSSDMCSPSDCRSVSSCSPMGPSHLLIQSSEDDSDEVLSVGSETPPPLITGHEANDINVDETPRAGLKFSIDNILKPDFGLPCDNSSIKQKSNKNKHSNAEKDSKIVQSSTTTQPINLSSKDTSSSSSSVDTSVATPSTPSGGSNSQALLWPAWVYCTRYSDRPSSGPRSRKLKRKEKRPEDKRPRTAFTSEQLARLKHEFQENRYLTERRRQQLASELKLNESQIKIWFQNKRAKIKKASGQKNPLALQLMAQGLYNHSTIPSNADSGDEGDYGGPPSPGSSHD